jgi:DNA polymerase III delta subunit
MPCYADEESDIVPIIKNFLLENKLSLDGETMKFIIEKFKHNREILKTELVK